MYLNLDELTLSLSLFVGFDNTFKINLFLEHFLEALDMQSLFSFSRIIEYVLVERQYMAMFAFVFYGFLVFGNMFRTFFISYRISLLFEQFLHCLNSFLFNKVFLNSPLTHS